jgi:hypothetical protein
MLRWDVPTKEWRELGVGALRVLAVPPAPADGAAAAAAAAGPPYASVRVAFSVPTGSGRRERVLVNSCVSRDTRMDVAAGAAGKPSCITLDLVVARDGGASLERFMLRVRAAAQAEAVAQHIRTATGK